MKAIITILLTMTISVFSQPVFAHKVSIFAWVEGDMVHTQSNFFGGKKIQEASIEVFDASGKRLVQGKTDKNGEFSFKAPVKDAMKIVVSAGMGHQAAWNLKASDFETPGNDNLQGKTASSPPKSSENYPASLAGTSSSAPAAAGMTPDEIREIVEKTLDNKLSPVLKMLSESRNRGPSVQDVLGGIGYIIGLVGLAAYVGSRKKKDNLKK
jgi:nickel transport protein